MAEDLTDDRPCAGKTNDDDVSSERTLDLIVSPLLRQAEREIGLALAKFSDLRPGMISGWPGAWGDYKALVQLMLKTRALADKIEKREKKAIAMRNKRANNAEPNCKVKLTFS